VAKHARAGGPVDAVNGLTPVRDQPRRPPSTGPKHTAPPRVGTRRIVGVALSVVLALMAVIGVGKLMISGLNPAPASSPIPASTTSAPSDSTAASSTAEGSMTVTLTRPVPASLPPTAPGLSRPGILMIGSPASDGSFDVVERIWLPNPVGTLNLRPAPIGLAGQQFASLSATATQVEVRAGSRTVMVPRATVDATVTLPVAEVDQFELRYRLTDVTVRSTPSSTGRALAALGPLIGGAGDDLPVQFIVSGETILGLSCPLLPLSQQSCGSGVRPGSGVQCELPRRLALTAVQFNLPPD
jgi:hypothetical protein